MHLYEERIKELKKSLLTLEHDVQELEQMGHLPYVYTPPRNYILICKTNFYEEYINKVHVLENIVDGRKKGELEKLIISLIDDIVHKE
jgi:7-cyano-7-deazaguanine synthase in queuosine biosynthesis